MTRDNLQFLRCHTYGHAWYEVDGGYKPLFGTLFSLQCERCGCTRNDIYDAHGQVASRNYRYPEGYRWGRVAKTDLRIDLMNKRRPQRRRRAG